MGLRNSGPPAQPPSDPRLEALWRMFISSLARRPNAFYHRVCKRCYLRFQPGDSEDRRDRKLYKMPQHLLTVSVIAMLVMSVGVSGKRGCSAFGHSCYGGHGKRSGDTPLVEHSNSEMMERQLGQEETPPHPVYPHSSYRILASGDDIIPIRDGGVFERDDNSGARDVVKMKLRNIVKHWMENYRRSQQNNDDGYFIEAL